ncbi:MAG: tetratricopeptide repeat protein [Deltaproteobacteria bacterium]|nr:tetratricopeptide repeat protein [Deltaproteobacteria bacterium]
MTAGSPHVAAYRSGLGWSLLRLEKREEARRAFQAALAVNPQDPSALAGLKELGRK